MGYPCLKIDLDKISHNSRTVFNRCVSKGISVVGVTKCFMGDSRIAGCMLRSGIKMLGDSRIENIKRLSEHFKSGMELIMLRTPMPSEIENVVDLCNISLNTQLDAISLISKVCYSKKKTHNIIIMIETDDAREGILPGEALNFCKTVLKKYKNIKISGLGTNARCISKTGPSIESLKLLCNLKKDIENSLRVSIPIISGGNSSIWNIVESGKFPPEINQVRVGEVILLGHETVNYRVVEGMHRDCFELQAEIIEVKNRKGRPYRLILALGVQDVNYRNLYHKTAGLDNVSQSSDHTVVEINKDTKLTKNDFSNFRVGGIISFSLDYFGVLSCMTSPFVKRRYV
ncbi:MAG: alanine racemase [Actinobacteria bacterium]|nr:alanine racemase [Actinomycetota bacterium]